MAGVSICDTGTMPQHSLQLPFRKWLSSSKPSAAKHYKSYPAAPAQAEEETHNRWTSCSKFRSVQHFSSGLFLTCALNFLTCAIGFARQPLNGMLLVQLGKSLKKSSSESRAAAEPVSAAPPFSAWHLALRCLFLLLLLLLLLLRLHLCLVAIQHPLAPADSQEPDVLSQIRVRCTTARNLLWQPWRKRTTKWARRHNRTQCSAAGNQAKAAMSVRTAVRTARSPKSPTFHLQGGFKLKKAVVTNKKDDAPAPAANSIVRRVMRALPRAAPSRARSPPHLDQPTLHVMQCDLQLTFSTGSHWGNCKLTVSALCTRGPQRAGGDTEREP